MEWEYRDECNREADFLEHSQEHGSWSAAHVCGQRPAAKVGVAATLAAGGGLLRLFLRIIHQIERCCGTSESRV